MTDATKFELTKQIYREAYEHHEKMCAMVNDIRLLRRLITLYVEPWKVAPEHKELIRAITLQARGEKVDP